MLFWTEYCNLSPTYTNVFAFEIRDRIPLEDWHIGPEAMLAG